MNKRAENAEKIAEEIRVAQEGLRSATRALSSIMELLSVEDPDHMDTFEDVYGSVRMVQYVLSSRDYQWDQYAKVRRAS